MHISYAVCQFNPRPAVSIPKHTAAISIDLYLTTHNTHNTQTSMPPGGIRTHNLSRQAAADPRLRPRGYWDRQKEKYCHQNCAFKLYVRIRLTDRQTYGVCTVCRLVYSDCRSCVMLSCSLDGQLYLVKINW